MYPSKFTHFNKYPDFYIIIKSIFYVKLKSSLNILLSIISKKKCTEIYISRHGEKKFIYSNANDSSESSQLFQIMSL